MSMTMIELTWIETCDDGDGFGWADAHMSAAACRHRIFRLYVGIACVCGVCECM